MDNSIKTKRMSRLAYEMRMYNLDKEDCNKDGIYMFESKEDIFYGLVIGSEGTPYHNGYLLFKIEFPEKYPFVPPKMTFISLDLNCRIHPNLYQNGYVCLSMINTWGENEYTPGLSLVKILRTIQSILTENPIEGEPDHENDKSPEANNYKEMVIYDIINLYQYHMVNDQFLLESQQKIPIDIRDKINPILRDLFKKNYNSVIKNIEKYKSSYVNNQLYVSYVYSDYKCKLNYDELFNNFNQLYQKLISNTTM